MSHRPAPRAVHHPWDPDCAEYSHSEHPLRVGATQALLSARRQRPGPRCGVPDNNTALLHRLIGDQPDAPAEILDRATDSTFTPLVVAAALLARDLDLSEATRYAATSRDRQLVALGEAHLRGNADLFDVLVRDDLCEHPDNLLARLDRRTIDTQPVTPAAPSAKSTASQGGAW